MKNKIDFEKAYGYITVGDTQYLRLSENDEWQEFFTVDDDLESNYKEKKPKDYKLITAILVITNIFTIILFTIALVFYKDCYNEMNKIQKELVEKKQEVEVLKDRTRLLEEDVRDCDWYIRFYDEFHEVVGAFE